MFALFNKISLILSFVIMLQSTPANAQLAAILGGGVKDADGSKVEAPIDEFGRNTPRGAVQGYIEAMASEDFVKASQYLDLSYLSATQRTNKGEKLVQLLQYFLDRGGEIYPPMLLSSDVEGKKDDNLPSQDRVGTIILGGQKIPVMMIKVTEQAGNNIWLFSASTLKQLPPDAVGEVHSLVNKGLPRVLVSYKIAGAPIGHWLVIIILAFASYYIAKLITKYSLSTGSKILQKAKRENLIKIAEAFELPVRLYLGVLLFIFFAKAIDISIILRQHFGGFASIVAGVALLILLWRLVDEVVELFEKRMIKHGNYGALSAGLFFSRGIKTILILIGVISVLDSFGIDVTTGLAALGIGGIALALGAQKTVENFVGSLTVIFDQPVRVGDFCQVGETLGTIEQIGIRSTRIRTLDRTLVTIPNGDFSAQKIENYAHRDKFRFYSVVGLVYETTEEQMKAVLAGFKQMLADHPSVDPDPARVRFVSYGDYSLNIEMFAYVRCKDWNEFLEIKEVLNFKIMDIVHKAGSDFAFPSQTIYKVDAK